MGGALFFLASNALFALNLRLLPALIMGIGCLGGFWVILQTVRKSECLSAPVILRLFAACLAAGFALNVVGGQGHIFYATDDWLIRDAVLADLSGMALPAYDWQGQTWSLRAPLGMYMLPGAVGRWAGLGAAHAFMLVQNSWLTGSVLYLIAEAFGRRTFVFVVLFIFFSGLDCVAFIRSYGLFDLPSHIEWWNPLFQYSSFVTQIFWVPNHALPGWWFAALVVLHMRDGGLTPILLVIFAAALIWSPLAMMGALPFVLYVLVRQPLKIVSPAVIQACFSGLAFLPVVIYLKTDAGMVQSGWLFAAEMFPYIYMTFIIIEIPHAAFVVVHAINLKLIWREALTLAIVMLLVIPFYLLGPGNDFAMRASIVPLVVLGGSFVSRVISAYEDKEQICIALAIVVLLGAATPIVEIKRNMTMKPYAISPCDLISGWRELSSGQEGNLDHYMARADHMPDWLISPPQEVRPRLRETQSCWPDHPVLSKKQS